jgi:hypothetical protein
LFGTFLPTCDENQNYAHWELFATRCCLYLKSNILSFFDVEGLHISTYALSDSTSVPFSDIPGLREDHWVSLGEIIDYLMIHWTKFIGLLNDKEQTEAMAALNRLDVGRLNEVLAIFTRFVKSAEGNSVSYFDICLMLQNLMANSGSRRANKYAEIVMKVV